MSRFTLFKITFLSFCMSFAQTSFTKTQSIALPLPGGNAPYNIASGLIDNDVFPDIVVSTTIGDHVYWLQNDGTGTFTLQITPIGILNNAGGVAIADLNNDGFNDVVSTSSDDGKIVWYANDGNGNFGTEQLINNSLNGPGQVYVRTIDNNNTPDVAVSAYFGNEVVWFANDGSGNFSSKNIINNTILGPGAFAMEDIDYDGDIDSVIGNAVAFGTPNDCRIEVFYNDGNGNFTADTNIVSLNSKDYIFSIMAEDVDDDSSLDILVTDITGDASWFKRSQISPGTATYTETVIPSTIANPACLDLRDLDNDNEKDFVLTSASSGSGNDIVWYKGDGTGSFGPEQLIDATQNQAYTITFADFDNDSDLDTATIAYGDDAVNIFRNELITLTVQENSEVKLLLFPNPSKDYLHMEWSSNQSKTVTIYDSIGRIVLKGEMSNQKPLNLKSLQSGSYFVLLEGQAEAYKLIKH